MTSDIGVGDRVWILPIGEAGEVWQVRQDSDGRLLFDVERDSHPMVNGQGNYVCRQEELQWLDTL